MKKLLTITFAILFVASIFTAPAMARCDGPDCSPATLGVSVEPTPVPVWGYDYTILPGFTGAAGGISGAIGKTEASGGGFVCNGEASVDLESAAGSFTTYKHEGAKWVFNPVSGADFSIGVISQHTSQAATSAKVKVKVDPSFGGFGVVGAHASGFAAEGSLDGSIVGPSFINGWETKGISGGIAGQGAVGGFHGSAFAASGPDYGEQLTKTKKNGKILYAWKKLKGKNAGKIFYKPFDWHPKSPSEWEAVGITDSKAGAGFGAGVEMFGGSYAQSYRYMSDGEGTHTEGMGTLVGAETTVNTYGYDYDYDRGLSCAHASVNGGFFAVGGAASLTYQALPGVASAKASAFGVYSGSGNLGTSYVGSAAGYTSTSITTSNNLQGAYVTSNAGMSVNSTSTGGGGLSSIIRYQIVIN